MTEQQPSPEDFNRAIIEEFRANGGKVGGMFTGAPMILLTTTGAKTGKPRTVPLVSLEIDGQSVIIASKAGADTHPAWYLNLKKNPEVIVEAGTERYPAIARVADPQEREQLFAKIVEVAPGYGEYQAGTQRVIPVVVLSRA